MQLFVVQIALLMGKDSPVDMLFVDVFISFIKKKKTPQWAVIWSYKKELSILIPLLKIILVLIVLGHN